jgi:rhodanese-related sulfurtransferase
MNATHARTPECEDLDCCLDPRELDEVADRSAGVPEVTPAWVANNRCRFRLVDLREPEQALDQGRVLWSEPIEHASFLEQALLYDREGPLIVMCAEGSRSAAAVAALHRAGFTTVASVAGGVQRWIREGLPLD